MTKPTIATTPFHQALRGVRRNRWYSVPAAGSGSRHGGGPSGPYPFDPKSGAKLARQASELASKRGGSLLMTTSARTPAATIEALFVAVTVPSMLYRWRRDDAENPFFGFLALADAIDLLQSDAALAANVRAFSLAHSSAKANADGTAIAATQPKAVDGARN